MRVINALNFKRELEGHYCTLTELRNQRVMLSTFGWWRGEAVHFQVYTLRVLSRQDRELFCDGRMILIAES